MATLANLLLLWPNRKKGEKHWENHCWPLNGALLCNDTLTEVSFTFSNIGTLITNNSAVDVLPEFCFWKLANGKLLKGDQSKIHKKQNTFPYMNNQLVLGVLLLIWIVQCEKLSGNIFDHRSDHFLLSMAFASQPQWDTPAPDATRDEYVYSPPSTPPIIE